MWVHAVTAKDPEQDDHDRGGKREHCDEQESGDERLHRSILPLVSIHARSGDREQAAGRPEVLDLLDPLTAARHDLDRDRPDDVRTLLTNRETTHEGFHAGVL